MSPTATVTPTLFGARKSANALVESVAEENPGVKDALDLIMATEYRDPLNHMNDLYMAVNNSGAPQAFLSYIFAFFATAAAVIDFNDDDGPMSLTDYKRISEQYHDQNIHPLVDEIRKARMSVENLGVRVWEFLNDYDEPTRICMLLDLLYKKCSGIAPYFVATGEVVNDETWLNWQNEHPEVLGELRAIMRTDLKTDQARGILELALSQTNEFDRVMVVGLALAEREKGDAASGGLSPELAALMSILGGGGR